MSQRVFVDTRVPGKAFDNNVEKHFLGHRAPGHGCRLVVEDHSKDPHEYVERVDSGCDDGAEIVIGQVVELHNQGRSKIGEWPQEGHRGENDEVGRICEIPR